MRLLDIRIAFVAALLSPAVGLCDEPPGIDQVLEEWHRHSQDWKGIDARFTEQIANAWDSTDTATGRVVMTGDGRGYFERAKSRGGQEPS